MFWWFVWGGLIGVAGMGWAAGTLAFVGWGRADASDGPVGPSWRFPSCGWAAWLGRAGATSRFGAAGVRWRSGAGGSAFEFALDAWVGLAVCCCGSGGVTPRRFAVGGLACACAVGGSHGCAGAGGRQRGHPRAGHGHQRDGPGARCLTRQRSPRRAPPRPPSLLSQRTPTCRSTATSAAALVRAGSVPEMSPEPRTGRALVPWVRVGRAKDSDLQGLRCEVMMELEPRTFCMLRRRSSVRQKRRFAGASKRLMGLEPTTFCMASRP
jgi:hypothetical protein